MLRVTEVEATNDQLDQRLAKIQLVILDVDGVLTDGRILYLPDGSEVKIFHVRDGTGIRMGMRAGLEFVIISGRTSSAVTKRAAELGISEVHQGHRDKGKIAEELILRKGLTSDQTSAIGDDLLDIPVFNTVGVAFAVADAAPEARQHADITLTMPGGRAAVREAVELILKAKGCWTEALEKNLRRASANG